MLQVKNILVPSDFSLASDDALTSACHWARKFDARIHVFHALQSLRPDLYPASLAAADPGWIPMTLRESASKELETRRRLATSQGVAVTCATGDGLSPAATVLGYVESHDIDLIVMSTHGRRGVPRMLLGSVAEEVVHCSNRPVLTTVPGTGTRSLRPLQPERILVAVDLSEHSRMPVVHAKHLAAAFGAKLQMLHVLVQTPLPACYDGTGVPSLMFDSPLLEKQALSALENLYDEADGPGGPVELYLARGQAVEQILRFAAAHSSDLLVLASHGLTGLPHLLMGSVAERVLRRATCPVLTVKSFGRPLVAMDDASIGAMAAIGDRNHRANGHGAALASNR
jgi:nucleotide-binding universal stress UspA family protein